MGAMGEVEVAQALKLVGELYEAAAEPGHWPRFLNALADATACEGTVLWLHDASDASARIGSDAAASFVSNVRLEESFLKSYAEYYTYRNILVHDIGEVAEGTVLTSSSIVSDADLHRSEYYNDWLRPQGIGYCLGGPVLKRSNSVALVSVSRPESLGPFSEADTQLMRLLMPHLRRACLLHQRLTRLRAKHAGGMAALELLGTAVWLLDAKGQLVFANQAGRRLDGEHDGLWIDREGRPDAGDPDERHSLRLFIDNTIAAARGLSVSCDGALSVRRHRRATYLHVMLYPLSGDAVLSGAAVAMFIFDPSRVQQPHAELLRTFYALTPAEARLAVALAGGETVQSYCEAHQLSSNTVRTHLKHVLSKTGLHRQSQLVALVAGLPRMAQ